MHFIVKKLTSIPQCFSLLNIFIEPYKRFQVDHL